MSITCAVARSYRRSEPPSGHGVEVIIVPEQMKLSRCRRCLRSDPVDIADVDADDAVEGRAGTLGSTRLAGESGGPPETIKACGSPTVTAPPGCPWPPSCLPTPTAKAIGATTASLILFPRRFAYGWRWRVGKQSAFHVSEGTSKSLIRQACVNLEVTNSTSCKNLRHRLGAPLRRSEVVMRRSVYRPMQIESDCYAARRLTSPDATQQSCRMLGN